MKILIVDDNPTNLRLLRAQLEGEGQMVFEAADGLAALALLEQQSIDAVITDILMPRMDGYRFCMEARQHDKLRHLPILVYTSTYTSQADEKLSLDAGADCYLTKPSPVGKILATIHEVVARKTVHTVPNVLTDTAHAVLVEYNQALVAKLGEKNTELQQSLVELRTANERISELNANLEKRVQAQTEELRKTHELERAILSAAASAIISTDPAGVITTFNPIAEKWLGYTAEEVIGQCTPAVWHDSEEIAAQAQLMGKALHRTVAPGFEVLVGKAVSGQIEEAEWTIIRRNGSRFPAQLSVTRLLNEKGEIAGFLGVLTDMTRRKRAEDRMRESEERFRRSFEDAPIGLALVSLEGRWLRVNNAICEMVGYTEAELLEIDFQTITHPDDLQLDLNLVRKLIEGHIRDYQIEKRYFHKTGQIVDVNLSVSLIRDHLGIPLYFVTHIQDVTQTKKYAAEREKLIGDLQRSLTEVKTLSGMLPICATCKKIRDDKGYWSQVESYVMRHTDASFSHGICPDCARKMMDEANLLMPGVFPRKEDPQI